MALQCAGTTARPRAGRIGRPIDDATPVGWGKAEELLRTAPFLGCPLADCGSLRIHAIDSFRAGCCSCIQDHFER